MSTIMEIAEKSAHVFAVSPWHDRHYIHLEGKNRAFRGDRTLRIWLGADGVLTVEAAKGSFSDATWKAFCSFIDEIEAAGAVASGYGDTIAKTYKLPTPQAEQTRPDLRCLTPDDLRQIGVSLYGKTWEVDLKDALGLEDSNLLATWMTGRCVIPDAVTSDLRKIADDRLRTVNEVVELLANIIQAPSENPK